MEVVAESVLSAALEVLFGKLGSPELLRFASQEEVISELDGWKRELLMINEVLDEAEQKQITKLSVKEWVDDLRDLAYDMEDVLDEFATEQLRRRLKADRPSQLPITKKVRNLIPNCYAGLNSVSQVQFNVEMGSKIKDITRRLDDISKRKADLGLKGLEKFGSGAASTWSRPPSTSLLSEPVYGRDEDKRNIIEVLLKDEAGESNFKVIPIVGMGGMGKTTLAQYIYRDDQIEKHFGSKAWVCLSDESDVEKLTKMILNAFSSDEIRDGDDFNQLQLKLSQHLAGKLFLLVLDDVWGIKSYEQWNQLRGPLRSGRRGSKIVITTRDANVASLMRADNYHYLLRPLSNQDCWSVFLEHVFEGKTVDEHPDLKSIGEQIIQKCGGLPLAAKLLGGLLRSKLQVEPWKRVLDSKFLNNNECGIIPVLRLSYQHLPSHLKRCFAYCALFPKDYEFERKELILLWMAEGLIHQPKIDHRRMEDLGVDYFNELLSRCFFQSSSNNEFRFLMHDLVYDLAQKVAIKTCAKLENANEISKSTRHVSFMRNEYSAFNKFEVCNRMEQLRTFFALPIMGCNEKKCYLSMRVFHDLLPKLRHLRVLSLSFYKINELPNSIGDLEQLRYLNLSHTALLQLPETISGLFNLQSLILQNCQELTKLPMGIVNLINLRHLDISGSTLIEDMPAQIGNLTNLQTLPRFVLSKGNGSQIKELKNLLNLRGKLGIFGLENVVDPGDVVFVNLKERPSIENLSMGWSGDFGSARNGSNETKVLEWLQPHQNLKVFLITCYGGLIFPRWLGDASYSNMELLILRDCKNITSLPSLGRLPLLKALLIGGMHNIKSIGKEFYGEIGRSFQSLERLVLDDMPEWRDWIIPDSGDETERVFPCLRNLGIRRCPKLNNLPHQLSALVLLCLEECQECTISIPRFQSLTHLTIKRCKEGMFNNGGVHVPSLTQLTIEGISKPSCLWEGLTQPLLALEEVVIDQCDEFGCLRELESLGGLRRLWIRNCDGVVSLEDQGLPYNLDYMTVSGCCNLEKLPNALHSLTSLTDLTIEKCARLVSFPNKGFPPMLKNLWVINCEALETLPDGMMNGNCALDYLYIKDCPSFIGFPKGELLTTLKKLYVKNCEKLESLPEGIMHPTCHLEYLFVSGCSSLRSIPSGDFFPSTLEFLEIWRCSGLDAIPGKTLQNLTSLSHLVLCNCPDLMSSSLQSFLAPSLKSLDIANGQNHVKRPLSAGGLHALTSLEKISIMGPFPDVISLADDWFGLLPASLTLLCLAYFANLKSMSSIGLQTLSSLKILEIWDCPKLRSFVSKEGLPPALESLEIWRCPILKRKFRKDKGKDWPRIAHIPHVKIDDIVQQ